METVENENYKPPHANEDGLERDEAVTEKLVAQGEGTKITFTNAKLDGKDRNGDAKIDIQGVESQFVGLSKEELMKYANDPFWVRLRMTMFVLFWVLWLAMLVGAVAIIVLTPRCAPPPRLAWWQSSPVYNVEVASYADSDGDGRGDIAGLTSKLEYIKKLGMGTLLLSNIFSKDASGATKDYLEVDPSLGSLADIETLLNSTKEKDLHVVLEINPAYVSKDHQWFLDSSEGKDGYQDVFIWEQGEESTRPDGVMPSGESTWTYVPARKAFYLHEAHLDAADVNWKSPKALELFTGVLRFWLERGISGFLVSDTYLDRTPVSLHCMKLLVYKLHLLFSTFACAKFRSSDVSRLLGVQVDRTVSDAATLYGSAEEPAADLVLSKPFEEVNTVSQSLCGCILSVQLGSASSSRLKERAGVLLDGLHMVAALVQGTPVFYNGDELGQECTEKPCLMPWSEEGAANPGISVEAQSGNSSHLEVVRHSTALRDHLAVRLGSTVTSVLGANSTVFVMLRVRKGTPGYMTVVNGDNEQSAAFLCGDDKQARALVSTSRCIYRNLALEQWLYENATFSPGSPGLLLLWWNAPAVVIGRHQNPWVECSLSAATRLGVTLARRNSGGGTVYHDTGNLNCCFMGHKRDYKRKANLQFIADTLNGGLGRAVHDQRSGRRARPKRLQAAKIGHLKAYHHCTVLVDVNTTVLHQVLGGRYSNIESKASPSVRASVKNIKELCPRLTVESLAASLASRFVRQHQDEATDVAANEVIHLVDPSEEHFAGIDAMCEKLQSWKWIFGTTPKFTISESFSLPAPQASSFDLGDALGLNAVVKVALTSYHGLLEDIRITPGLRSRELLPVISDGIRGVRFLQSDIAEAFNKIKDGNPDNSAILEFLEKCCVTLAGNALR
ncbi:hypothetical protein HPB50_024354 [Hyalomma asiaticum]|uniref:Uncharacterized protein n=1 Tax=Hyalomma asiaticum TaxID=266040 RepID=A0ACB7S2F5_HYAAI|nr:hypothetical protein HPB50_024354 [Hyalomma asiaticum]